MLLKDYSEDQIRNLINIIKDCVRENKYTIALEESRSENIQFIEEYNINESKRIYILCSLVHTDFCYGLQSMKDGVEDNNLYVFCLKKELYNIKNQLELVDIYLKFNILCGEGGQYRILVSMHKRNKPITYLFK